MRDKGKGGSNRRAQRPKRLGSFALRETQQKNDEIKCNYNNVRLKRRIGRGMRDSIRNFPKAAEAKEALIDESTKA